MLTSPPGGGFGPAATFTAAAISDLKIAPGHAVLSIKPVIPIDPMSISSQPVRDLGLSSSPSGATAC